jgi:hypothetical protein
MPYHMLHMKTMEAKFVLHADHDSMLQVHTPSKATKFSKLCYTHTNKRLYFNNTVRRDYSSPGRMGSTSTTSCAATTRLPVALPQPCHAPSCRSTYRRSVALAHGHYISRPHYSSSGLHRLYCAYAVHPGALFRRSTSRRSVALALTVRPVTTSSGRYGYTSTTPRVRVPRHVTRLVTRLVVPPIVDYFDNVARPGASARRVARHAARRAARRQLLRLAQARRRLHRLRRASGCLGTSRDTSRGSSSTTPCAATSSCGHTGSTTATPCVATTCLAATLALFRVRHVPPSRCLPVVSRRPFISTSFPN